MINRIYDEAPSFEELLQEYETVCNYCNHKPVHRWGYNDDESLMIAYGKRSDALKARYRAMVVDAFYKMLDQIDDDDAAEGKGKQAPKGNTL